MLNPHILGVNDKIYLFFVFISIGLLKLDTPIELNQYIQPVELSDVCDSPRMKGLPVTVAGTGRTTKEEPVSEDVLRYAQFTTMPSSSCVPYTNFKRASDSIICGFGNDTTEQVAHKGDSGSYIDIHHLCILDIYQRMFGYFSRHLSLAR